MEIKFYKTLALFWLAAVASSAFLSPMLFAKNSTAMDFFHVLEAPSFQHWLGTDPLGRDLLSRILCGSTVSLGVALVAVGLALLLGILVGAAAGYYGGICDRILMGFVDVLLCFPVFFLILAVIAVLGPNIFHVMLIIGATSWMGTARLVRAEVLSLKERDFILASRALGAGDLRILRAHLVPNAAGPVIVNGVLSLSAAILVETGLSFLGIGVQPPTPSWGNILLDGKQALGVAWWLTLFPGMAIFFTVLAVNILGEELQSKLKI